tara:strand:- start:407 stop:1150 length:744 start_codon:yes stop_codon:yes gene_type:complete
MQTNKVDIILPSFDCEDYLEQTMKSIVNQSFKSWRLIVIDDNSNLETKKILSRYKKNKKVKIIELPKNRGVAYCRNLGIKKSKSKYLAFIDSDDTWNKNKLKFQINFMEKRNLDFTFTYYKTIGLKKRNIKTPLNFTYYSFIKNTSIATSTMIVKRKIIKNIKFTNTKICEDYFFKCKILKKIKIAFGVNKFLTNYRIRSNSLQSNKLRNIYWIWKINKEYNELNFFDNLISILSISLNSLKKYGFK